MARAEDGGARGDAILAVLVLEAVVVVALDVLEKFRSLWRRHRTVVLVVVPNEGVTTTSPGGKDICADICRYLQISVQISLVTPADIRSRRKDILHRNQ